MRRALSAAAALVMLSGCTDPVGAARALRALGLTNIQASGWSLFGCSEDDQYHTRFTATNAAGDAVSGVVCGGWFKGQTVRMD